MHASEFWAMHRMGRRSDWLYAETGTGVFMTSTNEKEKWRSGRDGKEEKEVQKFTSIQVDFREPS